jgi:hypothetical protein
LKPTASFHAIRIDKEHHNEKICDKILTEIRRGQFVVADYTQQKGGVYFEDGFAMGLGRQVIRCCRVDDLKWGPHFDTRQYPHILWRTYKDLREQLADTHLSLDPALKSGLISQAQVRPGKSRGIRGNHVPHFPGANPQRKTRSGSQ